MKKAVPLLLFALVLIAAFLGYLPGTSGVLHFDDIPNLDRLRSADGWLLIADFVVTGIAGPTGRPLSLLTFIVQQSYWPDGLPILLATNIVFHLLAGVAVYLLAYALAISQPKITSRSAAYIALGTSALWLFSPFLISTQLMLVQRMATLSGLFVFAGLAAYCWGRLLQNKRPRLAFLLIWSGLLGGTLLATLSKENGILLAVLALCIERVLLSGSGVSASARSVRYFLYAVTGFIICYLAFRVPGLLGEGARAYTPWQRLISQPPIILDYLQNLLVPRTPNISPYTHWVDGVESMCDPRFIAGFLALALAGLGAVVLRRRLPVLSFAVLFFLAGHLLESSVIYLELYFAHRNYVPAFALYFALCVGAARMPEQTRKFAVAGLAGYVGVNYLVLVMTTSLWGQPLLAAEMWAKNYPESIRAQHALANGYTQLGDYSTATMLLDDMEPLSGSAGLYRVQPLLFCVPDEDAEARVLYAEQRFLEGPVLRGVGETVEILARSALDGRCPSLTVTRIERLANAVLASPAYQRESGARAKAWYTKALIAGERSDFDTMLAYLQTAFNENGYLDVGFFRTSVLVSLKRYGEALSYLDELDGEAPASPFKRTIWQKRVQQWREMVAAEAIVEV